MELLVFFHYILSEYHAIKHAVPSLQAFLLALFLLLDGHEVAFQEFSLHYPDAHFR